MLAEIPLKSVRDRMLTLRSLPSFTNLDEEGFGLLAENTRSRQFKKGQILMEEGRPVEATHVVVEGLLSVSKEGLELVQIQRSRGAGFLSVMSGDEEGITVTALEDTRTLELPGEVLLEIFKENFSLIRNSLRLLATGLLDMRSNLPVESAKRKSRSSVNGATDHEPWSSASFTRAAVVCFKR